MLKYDVSLLSNLKISVEDNKPNQNVEFLFHWLLIFCLFHCLRRVQSHQALVPAQGIYCVHYYFILWTHPEIGPFRHAKGECIVDHT